MTADAQPPLQHSLVTQNVCVDTGLPCSDAVPLISERISYEPVVLFVIFIAVLFLIFVPKTPAVKVVEKKTKLDEELEKRIREIVIDELKKRICK